MNVSINWREIKQNQEFAKINKKTLDLDKKVC